MSLTQYFPSYPHIDSDKFYQELYQLKEFNELGEKGRTDRFLHHQIIPSRFLSMYTFYQSLLLIHDTGTGKSGVVSSLINTLKKESLFMPILYLTSNDTLLKNFKFELNKLSSWVQDKGSSFKSEGRFYRKYNIHFGTFSAFANETKQSMLAKIKRFDKGLIVIDEAHNLITKNMNNYNILFKFIHGIPNRKVLVMSATPMRDSFLELIPLLNLVLPNPLSTGKDFVQEYLQSKKENKRIIISWKGQKEKDFQKKIQGYISFFRQKEEDLNVKYMGTIYKPMENTPLYTEVMSPFQTEIYMDTWKKDSPKEKEKIIDDKEQKEGDDTDEEKFYNELYNNSIQSGLMVFPNKTYGLKESEHYLAKSRFNSIFIKESGMIPNPTSFDQIQHNLKAVQEYSSVYHDVIQSVLNAKAKNQCVYVYSERINGSGILRCVYLLAQFFNFRLIELKHQKTEFNWSEKTERCIFLNEIDEKKTDIMSMIKAFNDPRNKFGEYIRVIFGTDKTTEGITLKNIQQIHIVTPSWNYGKKNQATGRGIRFGSHDALREAGLQVNVDIYLHCAIPNVANPMENSISFLQYTRGEFKENNILFFMYQLLITAVDCQLNYYQNFQEFAKDFTASCYFQKCKYPCLGITNKKPEELFYGNYNTFYNNNVYTPKIMNLFQNDASPKTFETILDLLSVKKDVYLVYSALQLIINIPLPIFINGTYFLIEQDGIFYCSPSRDIKRWNNKPIFSKITAQPDFLLPENTQSVKEKMYIESEEYTKEKISKFQDYITSKNVELFIKMFKSFPKMIQDFILEQKPELKFLDGIEWVNKREKWMTSNKEYTLDKQGNFDKILSQKEKQISQEELLKDNPFGIYAILTKSGIKIRDISTEKKVGTTKSKTKGQSCTTIDVEQIIYYIFLLQDHFDDNWKNYISPEKKHLYDKRVPQILQSKDIDKDYKKQQRIFSKLRDDKPISKEEMEWFLILKSAGSTRPSLCSYLLELLRNKNLVISESL